jgi:NADH:ubiquinone oxidoreductase subunit F (NADH-binding)
VCRRSHGTPLSEILSAAGAAQRSPVLVGGFHGAWLAADEVAVADLARASLAAWDATSGAGVLVVLPPDGSVLAETARIVDYLADQSARQCLACINGLPRLGSVVRTLADGTQVSAMVAEGHRLAALVRGRGACHHADGAARVVRSALRLAARASS